MSKLTLLLLFTLVLCTCTLSSAARSAPAFVAHSKTTQPKEDDGCGENPSEECLIRRTLAAHLDYIYTQKHSP